MNYHTKFQDDWSRHFQIIWKQHFKSILDHILDQIQAMGIKNDMFLPWAMTN